MIEWWMVFTVYGISILFFIGSFGKMDVSAIGDIFISMASFTIGSVLLLIKLIN